MSDLYANDAVLRGDCRCDLLNNFALLQLLHFFTIKPLGLSHHSVATRHFPFLGREVLGGYSGCMWMARSRVCAWWGLVVC